LLPPYFQNDVGVLGNAAADLGARRVIVGDQHAGFHARALLGRDFRAELPRSAARLVRFQAESRLPGRGESGPLLVLIGEALRETIQPLSLPLPADQITRSA
jgi:hypothetical protein